MINRKDDAVALGGSQHGHNRQGKGAPTSSGSETMACVTSRRHGNPGDPAAAFQRSVLESMPNNRTKGGRQSQRQGVGSSNSTSEGG